MPQAERAAGAVYERDSAILDLARAAFAAQLFGRFDYEENSAHPGMIRGEPAAVGVDREIAVEAEPPAGHECAAFTALAEAEIFQRRDHRDSERIVDHREVDIFVRDAGALEGEASRLRRGDREKIPLAARRMTHGLAGAENVNRLF